MRPGENPKIPNNREAAQRDISQMTREMMGAVLASHLIEDQFKKSPIEIPAKMNFAVFQNFIEKYSQNVLAKMPEYEIPPASLGLRSASQIRSELIPRVVAATKKSVLKNAANCVAELHAAPLNRKSVAIAREYFAYLAEKYTRHFSPGLPFDLWKKMRKLG